MSRRFLPILALGLGLSACTATGVSSSASDRLATVSSLTGSTTTGEGLYGSQCATCHGVSGQGGSGPRIAGRDETAVISAMLDGPDAMPSYSGLSDQEIADVAAFVIGM